MVECRTRAKKDGGTYKICYDAKKKEEPKPKPPPRPKPKPSPRPKPKEEPKVSEKAKKIIAAGKTTNRLEALPPDLHERIMTLKKEAEDKDCFQTGNWHNAGHHWKYGPGPNLQILKGGCKKGDIVEFRIAGKGTRIYKRKILQEGGHLRGKALIENAKTEPLFIRIPQDRKSVAGMRMDTEKDILAEDLVRISTDYGYQQAKKKLEAKKN
jgi:hypothetical protein